VTKVYRPNQEDLLFSLMYHYTLHKRQIPKLGQLLMNNIISELGYTKLFNLDYTNKFIIEYPSGSKYILNIGKLTTIINDKQLDNQLKIDYEDTLDILKTTIQENMFNIYMPFLINIDYAGWGADIYVKKMCL